MSAGWLVVRAPSLALPGWPLRCRVRVGDRWGAPGQPIAAAPGTTDAALVAELAIPGLWLEASLRFPVRVEPGGTTEITIALPAPLARVLAGFTASPRWGDCGQ